MASHGTFSERARRRRAVKLLSLLTACSVVTTQGCGGSFLGLEDFQRDLVFGIGSLAISLLTSGTGGGAGQQDPGLDPGGTDGDPFNPADDGTTGGLNCWDLDGNGIADPEEDINGDGVFDALDCQGLPGMDGTAGQNGTDGQNGINCWDLNENGIADPDEDINSDGVVDVFDCQGAGGGAAGQSCWDLNGNGVGDDDEDLNGDGTVDVFDCQGADGTDGSDGQNGTGGEPGGQGEDGAPGPAGPSYFSLFIDDFFTVPGTSYEALNSMELDNGNIAVQIEEPALGQCNGDLALGEGEDVEVLAYRMAMPEQYDPQNVVTMRMFVWRTGPYDGDCFIFQLDAFRARHGTGVDPYGATKYIKVTQPAEGTSPDGTLLVIDLPMNTPDGLGYPADLAIADFLAFELNSLSDELYNDGGCYTWLGVEFFEKDPADTDVSFPNAQILDEPQCTIDCNQNGIEDAEDIASAASSDCNDNGFPDECEIDENSTAPGGPFYCSPTCGIGCPDECDPDCNNNGIPDWCDIHNCDAPLGACCLVNGNSNGSGDCLDTTIGECEDLGGIFFTGTDCASGVCQGGSAQALPTANFTSQSDPADRPLLGPGENNAGLKEGLAVLGGLNTVDLTTQTAEDLVDALIGAGVSVSNITYSGVTSSAGTFSGGDGIVGCESGIILSSGNIAFVTGPNTNDGITQINDTGGDDDLDSLIPGFDTFDATILEFDFECLDQQAIQFTYVFSSDEYNEYVFSSFNDVFGFFLDGENIALVPGAGDTPVSINNVNCDNPYDPPNGNNCNLYINNDCDDIPPFEYPCAGNVNTEMDGLTLVFTATAPLSPGAHHIKLAIADAGDDVLDSNVFICGESFQCALPTGACCDTSNFTCQNNVLEEDCQGEDLVWSVGLACDDLDPPCIEVQAEGACCLGDGECVITTEELCDLEYEGEYQGDDTGCEMCAKGECSEDCNDDDIPDECQEDLEICCDDSDCEDGDPCTITHCVDGMCETVIIDCDDGDPCTNDGCEDGVCVYTDVECPDDGVYCNGEESCVEGSCQSSGDPCAENIERPYCNEDAERCYECLTDEQCNDGDACSLDTCNTEEGVCEHMNEEICPSVDLLFMMDTSGSMTNEADVLCASINTIIQALKDDQDIVVARTRVWGITQDADDYPEDLFYCLEDNVRDALGENPPGAGLDEDGCPGDLAGNDQSRRENWGPGTAAVSVAYDWLDANDHLRILVPISDEGPCLGGQFGNCNEDDTASILNAIDKAVENNVIASPIISPFKTVVLDCPYDHAVMLAEGTGGIALTTDEDAGDLVDNIIQLVSDACLCSGSPAAQQAEAPPIPALSQPIGGEDGGKGEDVMDDEVE